MKKITNANELVEGQKYFIELEYRKGQNKHYHICFFDENSNTQILSTTNELKFDTVDVIPLNIYSKTNVEAIDTPFLDEEINDLEIHKSQGFLSSIGEKHLTEYKKIKSILQNIGKQVELPIVDEKYEFSEYGKVWEVGTLNYYGADCGLFRHIRPIQQSEEELKAIELLKSKGYKIDK